MVPVHRYNQLRFLFFDFRCVRRFKFVDTVVDVAGGDVDSVSQPVGRHILNEEAGFFGVNDRIFPAAVPVVIVNFWLPSTIDVLVGGKHHDWRIKRCVQPLAVGGQVGPPVL